MNTAWQAGWLVPCAVIAFLLAPGEARASCTDRPAPGVDWSNCGKTKLLLYDHDFTGARFQGTNFSGSDLSRATMNGTDFEKADLTRAVLNAAKLRDADLNKALGHRAALDKAILTGANLSKSEFTRASFMQADLSGADLSKADFGRAVFEGAVLVDANLNFSNLSRADFGKADMRGADLTGSYTYLTDFSSVDLSAVRGLTQAQVEFACGDEQTSLPAGISRPESWRCFD